MFIAKKYFETNAGKFKKGDIVPNDIAKKYFRDVEETEGELLVETPSPVTVAVVEETVEVEEAVEVEETVEEAEEVKDYSNKNKRRR